MKYNLRTGDSGRCPPSHAVRRDGEAFIMRAVFAQQRLWLLADSGVLSSIIEGGDERIIEQLPEPVLDICVQNGDPFVVTGHQGTGATWTRRRAKVSVTENAHRARARRGGYSLGDHVFVGINAGEWGGG